MTEEISPFPIDNGCILHPKCILCPEPICGYEFPGGIKAYQQYKAMRVLLESGVKVAQLTKELCVHKRTVERRFNRVKKVTIC